MSTHNQEAGRAAPELLPCPFCGGAPEVKKTTSLWMVECNNAGCGSNPDVLGMFEHLAIAAWNRRTPVAYASADGLPPPSGAIAPNGRMVKWSDNYLTEPWLSHGYTPLYTAEQVRQAQREAVEADRRARGVALPTEVQLRQMLKEIPLCYPWGTGRILKRDGASLDWTSCRESTGSNTQLADMNKNFVNSAIAATLAALSRQHKQEMLQEIADIGQEIEQQMKGESNEGA